MKSDMKANQQFLKCFSRQWIMCLQLAVARWNVWLICVAIFLGVSCEPAIEPERTFLIKKGDHYSTPRLVETLQGSKLIFLAKFDLSARYQFNDVSMQSNKNKLLGFSDCNEAHHQNSARFAWQWYNNRLEIFAYCYIKGIRVEQFLGSLTLDEYHHFELEVTASQFIFKIDNLPPVSVEKANTCTQGVYYLLWPYFGGTLPAPHNVSIKIRRLN
jgi:hypothetical protein